MSASSTTQVYSFGTSGYRSDDEAGFNEAVVRQITHAICDYVISEAHRLGVAKPLLVGGDTREKSRRFIPIIAELVRERGIDVFVADGDVPTPVLAYAAAFFKEYGQRYTETAGAILMTASHNPWPYGGFNFLTPDGAVAPSPVTKAFESYQREPVLNQLNRHELGLQDAASITRFDPYPPYQAHLKNKIGINYQAIRSGNLQLFYDPLYATGRNYFPRLLRDEGIQVQVIHDTDARPADYAGMPEPSQSNLKELAHLVTAAPKAAGIPVGFANDGDSDRFGVLDEAGHYVTPNDVLALTVYHLLMNRKQRGVIVRSQATSHFLDALAEKAGLKVVQTPVGYKYIAEEFLEHEAEGKDRVLIGGESSGGMSIIGHIPEKDGLLANLIIAEMVAVMQQPLSAVLQKVRNSIENKYLFKELGMKTPAGQEVLAYLRQLQVEGGEIGGLSIDVSATRKAVEGLESKYGTRDGAKIYLEGGSWLLVRASGTEPLVRVYVEAVAPEITEAQGRQDQIVADIVQLLIERFGVAPDAIQVKH